MRTRCLGEIKFDKRQAWQWQIADFGEQGGTWRAWGPANVRAVHSCHASLTTTAVALQGAMRSLAGGGGGLVDAWRKG